MLRRFSTNFAVFSIFLDWVLITLSLYLSIFLRNLANRLTFVNPLPALSQIPIELYLIFPFLWVVTLLSLTSTTGARISV